MIRVEIPARIDGKGLLPFLSQLDTPTGSEGICLDFRGLRRVTPAGLVSLVATVIRWRREGREIAFAGLRECPILAYLQRMDVLRTCGIELPESFRRHEARGRFVPVTLIEHPVDEMGKAISACVAPGGEDYEHPMAGLYDFSYYVLTELGNNVRQHSAGLGYASAQVQGQQGFVRLAMADNGMGIRASFRNIGAAWSETADDAEAIRRALEPLVSCKAGDPNQGVGLTLVSELARLTGARLMIVSGRGVLRIKPGDDPSLSFLPDDRQFQGTMLTMVLEQGKASDFPGLLQQAKVRAGLLRTGGATGRFQP